MAYKKVKTFKEFNEVFGDQKIEVMDNKGNYIDDYENRQISKIFPFDQCSWVIIVK